MQTGEQLKNILLRIDGKGYKAYKDIRGSYACGKYTLYIDNVQADPFAAPGRMRVRVSQEIAQFPQNTYSTESREIALRDFLTRKFARATLDCGKKRRGSGKSGLIAIDCPGQEILERTSVLITDEWVEARFVMGLPANGRRIAGRQAVSMFFDDLPAIISKSLLFANLKSRVIYEQIEVCEDADFLRNSLIKSGYIAFVADGAVLPRASGVDQKPLSGDNVIAFCSPPSMRAEFTLPNRGAITGMGIPCGITLIVGGGYHGKSTLLTALERGVYNHIPGDGREFVVMNPEAVKIRAEDGRRVEKVDISPFINNLPFGQDTGSFSTDDASGSTSQAANIIEALEAGAKIMLIDEDTSATNFMIRDHRMQKLVSKEKEPITPFIDKISHLYTDLGVSTVLVIGGSGDYFDVADTVICMDEYLPYDCTDEAHTIAEEHATYRACEGGENFGNFNSRMPVKTSINPGKGKRDVKIAPKGVCTIAFGVENIDLSSVEQLADQSQTRAIGDAIWYATRYMDDRNTLQGIIEFVSADIRDKGLDVLSNRPVGDYAAFRKFELAAALNRLRTLRVTQKRA